MRHGAGDYPHSPGFDYIELAGPNVRLRPTTADDAAPAFALVHNNRTILDWLMWKGPESVAELEATYGTRWPEDIRRGTSYALAVEKRDRPGFIGCIDARSTAFPGQFEIGYWLGVPYWRQGYMPEALSLMCYFCFEHLGAEVVLSSAFVGNPASRRVMEKNGFKFEGTLRRHLRRGDEWIDVWHLSLLREEWQKRGLKPVCEKLVPHAGPPAFDLPL